MNPQQPNDNNVPPVSPYPAPEAAPQPQMQPQPSMAPPQPQIQPQQPAPMAPNPFGQAPQPQPGTSMPFGPAPQPGAPAPFPGAPVGMQPVPRMPKKPIGKGLLFGIIGGVVGLLAIVGIVLVATGIFSVSHDDYVEVQNALTEDAISNFLPDTSSENITVDDMLGYRDSIISSTNEYLDSIGSMKAVRLDSELTEQFKNVRSSLDGADQYFGVTFENTAIIMAVAGGVSARDGYVKQSNDMISTLEAIQDKLRYEPTKNYVAGLIQAHKDALPAAKRMDANREMESYSDYDSGAWTAYEVLYDTQDKLRDQRDTGIESLTKDFDAEAFSKEMRKFNDMVDDKVKETA